jgi:predicted trehalose synthase
MSMPIAAASEGVRMQAYPHQLTKHYWNKSLGLFAKAKRTGIGDALSAMESAYADSVFTFNPLAVATKTADPAKFERWMAHLDTRLRADAAKIDEAAATVQAEITVATSAFADDAAVVDALRRLQSSLVTFRASVQPGGPLATQFGADVRTAHTEWTARQATGSGP